MILPTYNLHYGDEVWVVWHETYPANPGTPDTFAIERAAYDGMTRLGDMVGVLLRRHFGYVVEFFPASRVYMHKESAMREYPDARIVGD